MPQIHSTTLAVIGGVWSAATFFGGYQLGYWYAVRKGKRQEWNALVKPLLEGLESQLSRDVPTFNLGSTLAIEHYMSRRRKAAFLRDLEAYRDTQKGWGHVSCRSIPPANYTPEAMHSLVRSLMKHLALR